MSAIQVSTKANDVWCYDTGASIHVTNNRALLSNYRPVVSSVMVGNTETTILGYGELRITPTKSLDGTTFPLKEVAYCPGFHINLISAERASVSMWIYCQHICIYDASAGSIDFISMYAHVVHLHRSIDSICIATLYASCIFSFS